MIANSDTYVVYIQVSSRSTTNLAPSQIRYDWRSSQWKVERNESWKSKKAKTRKTKVTICVPINVFELNASCFSMSIKFGIQARTVHNTGWMVNVTVNDSTRATLDTHTNTDTETKPNHTASRRRVQLRGGWSTELKLKAEPEAELDTRPNSWLQPVERERESDRQLSRERQSVYLRLCLLTFSTQSWCSCSLNEAESTYVSTHCIAVKGDGTHTHTHALYLLSGSITCAGEWPQSAAWAQWSNN